MKKSKITFPDRPDETFEMIVISNHDELFEYAKFKQKKFTNAFQDILQDKDKNYNAEDVMNTDESPETRLIKLLHCSNDLVSATQMAVNKVIMGMEKSLRHGFTLLVNEVGGYNIKRPGEFEILGDVKDSYPNIKKGVNSAYLVIENATKISQDLEEILKRESIDTYNIITELKTVPINVLQKELGLMIVNGLKEIIFETQLVDHAQIESMSKLLNALPPMSIRVLTASPENLPETKHKIILHSYTAT